MSRFKQCLEDLRITQAELAKALGVSQPTISEWVARNRPPAERVLAIESATGISRFELRPDLYPPETDTEKARA